MAKGKNETAVAEKKTNDLMVMSETAPDYISQDSNRGSENVTTEDLVIPRLEIIQALSPAVKRGDPDFVEGAQAGQLINSVTKQIYGDSVLVVPVHFSLQYLVWQSRRYYSEAERREITTDGGFFGAFNSFDEAQARANEEGGAEKGVEVIDTPQHLCLLANIETGEMEEIMLSMPRTKAKISRQWNSLIKLNGGDRFGRVYQFSTELVSNKKGDFYNFKVRASGYPSKPVYAQAEALYEMIHAGERKVVVDTNGLNEATETAVENESGM